MDDPGGGVEQPVAQLLRFGLRQGTVQQDRLGPGDQVGGGDRELQPGGIDAAQPAKLPDVAGQQVVLEDASVFRAERRGR